MSRPDFKAFAWAVLEDWPESGPDMFHVQDLAVKHGLLLPTYPVKPCDPESCSCAEYHGTEADGTFSGAPITCYRRSAELAALRPETEEK